MRHALARGYDLHGLRARLFRTTDFTQFDMVLAMDWDNLAALKEQCPPEHLHRVRRLMEFAPPGISDVVPDPYYGGRRAFELVLDHVEAACSGLLSHIRARLA